jgi:hypothetical protein
MQHPANSSTASRRTDGFAGSAISAVKRDSVGCDANPGPLSGVSPAAELVARAARRIVAQRTGIIVVAPTLRHQQPGRANKRGEVMRDIDLTARIRQAGSHPTNDAALLDNLAQEHRTGIASLSVNATFDAQRAVETHRDRK